MLGDGQSHYVIRDQGHASSATFTLLSENIRQILRRAYEIRFFDLGEWYIAQSKLSFGEDGSVSEGSSMSNHQRNVRIIIQIGDYSKTVLFGDEAGAPSELVKFADEIESLIAKDFPALGGR